MEVKLGEHQTCKATLKKGRRQGEVCGYRWLPRSAYVIKCPECQSFYWWKEAEKVKK